MHAIRTPSAYYTIDGHQGIHGVAYATARADLFKLAAVGYLRQEKAGRRYHFFPGPRLDEAPES